MFYREALDDIRGIERAGSDYGIERMRELLALLGNPDRKLKFVHVAGTNGKGSVCAMLTAVFRAAGYRTGTYNSPSVLCYNERFLLNGEPLCDDDVAKYMTEVRDAIERERARRAATAHSEDDGTQKNCTRTLSPAPYSPHDNTTDFCPTAFEIETAVALVAFFDKGCDVCVLETGLGGRWDATNAVCDKELAVITPIGLDHCALLGDTIAEIAEEKAAIIRDLAVTCPQEEGAAEVLARAGARVTGEVSDVTVAGDGQHFVYEGKRYFTRLKGRHQTVNAALAIEAVKALREKGWKISDDALSKGLKDAVWRVRFEMLTEADNAKMPYKVSIPHGKALILDGAHNPHGACSLREALIDYTDGKNRSAVFGVLADKDYKTVAKTLAPLFDEIYTVTPVSPRALDCNALADTVKAVRSCADVTAVGGVKSAVERSLAGGCDCTVVFGSLTLFSSLTDK